MARQIVIGVMGPGKNASSSDLQIAFKIGELIASLGCLILTEGRNSGLMEVALKGAKNANELTIRILPGSNTNNMSC